MMFGAIKHVSNPTSIPLDQVLGLIKMIINYTKNTNSDEINLCSILKQILAQEKINEIRNDFQTLEVYLEKHYPHVTTRESKIHQLNSEIKKVRTHCTTLWNATMSKDAITIDTFSFYITGK